MKETVYVKVGCKFLQDVRFTDDHGMVADTKSGLQKIMERLSATAEEYGMKINIKKTKVMRVSKSEGGRVSIMIEGKRLNKFGISSTVSQKQVVR